MGNTTNDKIKKMSGYKIYKSGNGTMITHTADNNKSVIGDVVIEEISKGLFKIDASTITISMRPDEIISIGAEDILPGSDGTYDNTLIHELLTKIFA